MSSKPGSNKPAGKTMSSKPGSNKPAGKNQGRGNKKPFVNPHRLINGSKGFLFSHTLNRDKESKREAYNLLKNYADIMYGPEESDKDNADIMYGPEESDKDKKDIEDALKAEIKEIKSSKKARRFTALQDFGCTLFVGCDASIDPTALTEFIVENQRNDTAHKVSLYHILRMEPVQDTCYVDVERIGDMALKACGTMFDGGSKRYSVAYKARNSKMVEKMDVIDRIAGSIGEEHIVDLVNPEFVILVNVWFSQCGVSVVKRFMEFKRYSLQKDVVKKDDAVVKGEEKLEVKEDVAAVQA